MKKIYNTLFDNNNNGKLNTIYNLFMMFTIIISIIPLTSKSTSLAFDIIDKVTVAIFIVDYILRWITANEKYKKGFVSFIKYPFSVMAIIDLLSILPSFTFVASGFRLFKLVRLIRTFKIVRVFKVFRYSKNIDIILKTIKEQKNALITVLFMAIGYIMISALIVFNVEPNTFNNFFEAVYWATISLTTVGYGDVYPVTNAGRIVTMLSSFVGIAIVALPAGILTAGYMKEIKDEDE